MLLLLPDEVVVEAPQPPKSISGVLAIAEDLGCGLLAAGGSGVAQASLEPQASAVERLEKDVVVVAGATDVDFGASCAGVERLNAELMVEVGWASLGGEGLEKSKRSFETPFVVDCLGAGGDVVVAKLKSPKALEELVLRIGDWEGGLAVCGF